MKSSRYNQLDPVVKPEGTQDKYKQHPPSAVFTHPRWCEETQDEKAKDTGPGCLRCMSNKRFQ